MEEENRIIELLRKEVVRLKEGAENLRLQLAAHEGAYVVLENILSQIEKGDGQDESNAVDN